MPTVRTDPVSWESVTVPTKHGCIGARVFRPNGARRGWLVWAHGGSWTGGSVAAWHDPCADLARLAGATLVSVEYRLAPQHPHPAALHDVLAVLDWTEAQARAEGGDDHQVAVGGDSAGGTIAACAALVWRDQDRPLAAQVLAYPPLDQRCEAASYTSNAHSFPSRAGMLAAWRTYRGSTVDTTVYSTPFEAADLRGLAPAVIGVGELDPVADDARTYARRLSAAGNTVEYREFRAMAHGSFVQAGCGFPAEHPLRHWLGGAFRGLLAAPAGSASGESPSTTGSIP